MHHDLIDVSDPAELATRGAETVAARARAVVADGGRFHLAVSGGSTPWQMFAALVEIDVPWQAVEIFQVDERIAADGDPDRNLTHLLDSLRGAPATVHAMPITDADPEAGAAAYAERLPERGAGKHSALAKLFAGDRSIPAGRVTAGTSTIVADAPARHGDDQ